MRVSISIGDFMEFVSANAKSFGNRATVDVIDAVERKADFVDFGLDRRRICFKGSDAFDPSSCTRIEAIPIDLQQRG
jgi:hypothetical protein